MGRMYGMTIYERVIEEDASLEGPAPRKLFNAEGYINQSLSVVEAKRLMQTLRDSAMVDPLTGLHSRRFFQDHTKQLISGALRPNKQIGQLVCDPDYFKQVTTRTVMTSATRSSRKPRSC